jgi:hypothetical protein
VIDLAKTDGFALHDKQPERIAGLFDEASADASIGTRRTLGQRRQRGFKPLPKARERRRPLFGDFVLENFVTGPERIHGHSGALREQRADLSCENNMGRGKGQYAADLAARLAGSCGIEHQRRSRKPLTPSF